MNSDAKRWDLIHKKINEAETDGHSNYAQEKEKLFPRNAIICDLGGGSGSDAIYFLKNGHRVILLDISQFALEVAQKKAKELGLEKGLVVRQVDFGLHTLPLSDNSVDVTYSRIALHYFPKDETIGIFAAIYKSLKPGGKVYITFKSPDDEEEMEYLRENAVEYETNVYIENGQLRSRFPVTELENMMSEAGIRDSQVVKYQEQLSQDKDGHRQTLYLNEITFTKQ
jgi:ubiquinone/menaquinone biosynthesis C-methylase UbiE